MTLYQRIKARPFEYARKAIDPFSWVRLVKNYYKNKKNGSYS